MAQLRSLPAPLPELRSSSSPPSPFPWLPPRSPSFARIQPSRLALRFNGSRFSCSISESNPVSISPDFERNDLVGSASSSAITKDRYVALEESAGGGNGAGSYNGRGGGGGSGGGGGENGRESSGDLGTGGFLGAFLRGWQDRVRTDPQFPFKVLMEEVVGVGACVLGDMASRPNFGLNELDFVFSTIVVGSILNFTLMYMLAPTSAAGAASSLPGLFATCPPGHMFESGAYSLFDRFGTFVYKGVLFSAVGFGAGLVGTFISNFLLNVRKKMDPSFVVQNKAPPTVLNAATWAIHMGVSSNLRYQALNGLEFGLANYLNPTAFKASVFFTRGLNNVLGGVSFVTLARLTGSQKALEAEISTDETLKEEKASPTATKDQDSTLQPNQASP